MRVEVRRKYGRDRGHEPMSEEDILRIRTREKPGVVFVTPEGKVPADLRHLRMVEDTITLHADPTREPGPDNPSVIVPEHVLAALFVSGCPGAEVEIRGRPGYADHVWRADCYVRELVEELGGPADPPEGGFERAAKRVFIREGEAPSRVRNVRGAIEPDEEFTVVVDGERVPLNERTVVRGNVSNKTPEHAALDVAADVAMLAGTCPARVSLDRPGLSTSVHPTDIFLAASSRPGCRVCSLNSGWRMRGAMRVEKGQEVRLGVDPSAEVCLSELPEAEELEIGEVRLVRDGERWRVAEGGVINIGQEVIVR